MLLIVSLKRAMSIILTRAQILALLIFLPSMLLILMMSLQINANTAVTGWLGEGMDLGMAVQGLLWRSGREV